MLQKLLHRLGPSIGLGPELRCITDRVDHLVDLELSKRIAATTPSTLNFDKDRKGH